MPLVVKLDTLLKLLTLIFIVILTHEIQSSSGEQQ